MYMLLLWELCVSTFSVSQSLLLHTLRSWDSCVEHTQMKRDCMKMSFGAQVGTLARLKYVCS